MNKTQLFKCRTRITRGISSVLTIYGLAFLTILSVGILDHQLINCTRNSTRIKIYFHKQITFSCLKSYSPEVCEEALRNLNFSKYELFDGSDNAHELFIHRDMVVIDIHEKNDSKRKITQGLKNLACMLVKITIKKRTMKRKKRTEDYKM